MRISDLGGLVIVPTTQNRREARQPVFGSSAAARSVPGASVLRYSTACGTT